MNPPKDPVELDLVILAIRSHRTRGCCEWLMREAERVKKQGLPLPGMTTVNIRELLVDFVIIQKGLIEQMEEKRPHYSDRDFWYRAVIPVAGLPRGLFVEIVMDDPDPDCPAVIIVNAHA